MTSFICFNDGQDLHLAKATSPETEIKTDMLIIYMQCSYGGLDLRNRVLKLSLLKHALRVFRKKSSTSAMSFIGKSSWPGAEIQPLSI